MASIVVEDVTVTFPVYGSQKMFRRELAARVGGLMRREGRHNRLTIHALEGISLEIRHGDRVGFLGPNGAGKSTLLRVLAGVYEPTAGRVVIEGRVSLIYAPPGKRRGETATSGRAARARSSRCRSPASIGRACTPRAGWSRWRAATACGWPRIWP